MREAVVLATVLRNPTLAVSYLSHLENLHPSTPEHGVILHAILTHCDAGEGLWLRCMRWWGAAPLTG